MKRFFVLAALIASVSLVSQAHAGKAGFEGYKKCGGCHKSQKDSWLETVHANAMHSLKPGEHEKEKIKVKLDPKKDYSEDKDCLPCHTTGYGQKGGYKPDMPENKAKFLSGVGCEDCHGPGSLYRKSHSDAGKAFKASQTKTARKELLDDEQIFDYEEACARCHMNYEGSPWKKAKKPYSPYTPKVDPKYKFDFAKEVKETGKDKGMHEHFKLRGVYDGEPLPKIREEFQKKAKEPAAGEEEEAEAAE